MKSMALTIRPLPEDARAAIASWPKYEAPFELLDYALRPGTGWLDLFGGMPECRKYGIYRESELVAFTLLVLGDKRDAEFYVAVRADQFGEGTGSEATRLTLKEGFENLGLETIFLKVRVNHKIGIHIYSKAGFENAGRITEITNGLPTEYYKMTLSREAWRARL